MPHRLFDRPFPVLELDGSDQRAVLNGGPFRSDEFQSVAFEKLNHRFHRVVAHMFVKDRCDEHAINDIEKILSLKAEQAIGRKHGPHAFGHLSQIVSVGEHVEGADHVSRAVLSPDLLRELQRH